MAEPLRGVAARPEPVARHAAELLQRTCGTPDDIPTTGPQAARDDDLSDRELEVLRLLATGLTGREIAQQLFAKVNTLRTHTGHIFTRLDVNTGRAAVLRATDRNLL